MSGKMDWKITIEPGLPEYDEYLKYFKARENFGSYYTDYTFHNETQAKNARKVFEGKGYVVRMYDPNGDSVKGDVTYGTIYAGIRIK